MQNGEVSVSEDGTISGAICNCCADCCFPHQLAEEDLALTHDTSSRSDKSEKTNPVMQKAQVGHIGFGGNPIRGRVKLVHKGA